MQEEEIRQNPRTAPVRRFYIPAPQVACLLNPVDKEGIIHTAWTESVPFDSQVLQISWDASRNAWCVIISHDTFDPIQYGEEIPELQIEMNEIHIGIPGRGTQPKIQLFDPKLRKPEDN